MASLVDVPLLQRLANEWPQSMNRGDARQFEFRRVLLVLGEARFMRRFIERESGDEANAGWASDCRPIPIKRSSRSRIIEVLHSLWTVRENVLFLS